MRKRFVLISGVIALAVLIIMLNFTTPTGVGPLGVLVFFTTLYVLIFDVLAVVANLLVGLIGGRGRLRNKDFLYIAVLAFGPVIVLLLQGFGRIGVATLLVSAMTVGLGCFLVHKKA